MSDPPDPLHGPRHPVVEVISDQMARVLASKSGGERLEMAFGMMRFARETLDSSVRAAHPEWDEESVAREVAHRFSHGAV